MLVAKMNDTGLQCGTGYILHCGLANTITEFQIVWRVTCRGRRRTISRNSGLFETALLHSAVHVYKAKAC